MRSATKKCLSLLIGSAHTDSIITEDSEVADIFLHQVDRYSCVGFVHSFLGMYLFMLV